MISREPSTDTILTGLLVLPESLEATEERAPAYESQLRAVLMEESSITLTPAQKLLHPAGGSRSLLSEVSGVAFLIADVTECDSGAYCYVGLARALGKPIITICEHGSEQSPWVERLSDFFLSFDTSPTGLAEFSRRLRDLFRDLLQAEARDRLLVQNEYLQTEIDLDESRSVAPLAWELLSSIRFEHLVHELLLCEGFRRIRWLTSTNEVCLVALHPADDGREEVYILSVGGGLSDDMTVQLWRQDLATIIPLLNSLSRERSLFHLEGKLVVNVRFLWSPESSHFQVTQGELKKLDAILRQATADRARLGYGAWTQRQQESLLRRYPMLMHKYFSEEGFGFESVPEKRRLETEDFYLSATEVAQRAAEAAQNLEKEYGIDPGAKWQELAYTATHSIGNAIFPIEVYIDHLREVIQEVELPDGRLAVTRAMSCVEKAKVHIKKFKSIASSKDHLNLGAVALRHHIDGSLANAKAQGMKTTVFANEHLPPVWADPDMADEIFDELVTNAILWTRESEDATLTVTVKEAKPDDLPSELKRNQKFLWLRFADNGPGVPRDMKAKIFELFFSNSEDGMGFGLSMARKNMRGFGGEIEETGEAGQGAQFDLFFPIYKETT